MTRLLAIQRSVRFSEPDPSAPRPATIEQLIVHRPPDTTKAIHGGENTYHTTAFVVFQHTLVKRLTGLTFAEAVNAVEELSQETSKLPGAKNNKGSVAAIIAARKQVLTDLITKARSGISELNYGYYIDELCIAWLHYRNALRNTRHNVGRGARGSDAEGFLTAEADKRAQVLLAGNISDDDYKNFTDYALGSLDLRSLTIKVTLRTKDGKSAALLTNRPYLEANIVQHYLTLLMLYPRFKSSPIREKVAAALASSVVESGRMHTDPKTVTKANDFKIDIGLTWHHLLAELEAGLIKAMTTAVG